MVAVVRPEEVEVAPARDDLASGYLARGAVEEVMFTGALERLRVRLEDGAAAAAAVVRRRGQHAPRCR